MHKIFKILFVLICLFMTACNKKEIETIDENLKDNSENNASSVVIPAYINTPYCELAINKEYEDKITTVVLSSEPYVIRFETIEEKQHLFTLYFGEESDELLGTLPLKDDSVVIYAQFANLNSEKEKHDELLAYQATINTIVDYLVKDYGFLIDQMTVDEEEVIEINTYYVTLSYPSKWQNIVKIDNNVEVIKFSAFDVSLFDIYFTECEGDFIGFYDKTPIYLISYTFDKENLSDEEYSQLCAMQKDVNVIIEHLFDDEKFTR